MVQLKADLNRESNYNESGGGRSYDPVQYSPLPTEGGMQVHNKVVVSLVAPALWKMFNPTVEDIDKYGLRGESVFGDDREWGSLYFQLPTHRVANFSYPNGNTGFAYSICPVALNKYLVEGLELAPLFDTPVRCAYCEEKERLWDEHNEAWESLGLDRGSLSKEGYFAAMKKHDILQTTRESARQATPMEKYVVSVFDHDKFTSKRQLDEGQTAVTWQAWYAPNAIYRGIKDLHKGLSDAGMPAFFDFSDPQGVHILSMLKDTTGWTAQSKLKTEYAVQNLGERYQYSPEWVAYLSDDRNYADPSSFMHMLSYEEQKFYIEQQNEKKSFNRPRKTTVTVPENLPAQAPPPPAAQAQATPQEPAPTQVAPQAQTPPAPVPADTPAPAQATPPTPAPAPADTPAPAQATPPTPAPAPAGPPIPNLPPAATPATSPTPAAPVPATTGAPVPDRQPPVGGPPPATARINWDD